MATAMAVCSLVAAIASPLLECSKLVCGPIYRITTNLFKLQSNLNALETTMKDLAHLTSELEEAEKNGSRGATQQVRVWQRQAKEIMDAADQIMTAKNNTGCFIKCGLSREVSKTLKEAQRLAAADTYPAQFVATNCPTQAVEHIPTTSIENQATASRNLAKIMEVLNCDQVRRVGVWGMGGVGKTTLVKNLNNKLESTSSTQPFGKVIWTTVSKDMNLKTLQTQIAVRLGFHVRESDEVSMSTRLHERLLKENKFLLILDDVWEHIDLDLLGIPKPEVHTGYKILLTSRSQTICAQMDMDAQLKVAVLNDDEAWHLFSSIVGEVAHSEHIMSLAKEVARECHGLPLAINVVGTAVRKEEMVAVWKNVLNELKRLVPPSMGIEKEVFNPLKFSYDSLRGNNIKSCFLYCCLYPEDFSIDTTELVQCWVGEGLIEEQVDYEDSINQGISLLKTLTNACLLEDGERKGSVKMHDVVRDVAIWIASSLKDGCKFLIQSGAGLTHIPRGVEFTKSVRRVSLMNNKIKRLPSGSSKIECSMASTLFLQGNKELEEIPEGFLEGFLALRVLNLGSTGIKSLPPCIVQLGDLRTLVLRSCRVELLSSCGLGGLKAIQVLDLSCTNITELPKGIENLSNLKDLNLTSTSLKTIPAGIFPCWPSLGVLQMKGSDYVWGLKGEVEDGEATLEDLGSLKALFELSIRLKRIPSTNCRVWISKLSRFHFTIGLRNSWGTQNGDRMIHINNNSLSVGKIESLLSNATGLVLMKCTELDCMLTDLAINNPTASFSSLKTLCIVGCNSSISEVRSGGASQYDALPNLECLELCNLKGGQKSISELFGNLQLRFSKLKQLTVSGCNDLECLLFIGGIIQKLENLEEMNIRQCSRLLQCFATNKAGQTSVDSFIVPNLRKIILHCLPSLRIVCNPKERWPRLEKIEVRECNQLSQLPLSSQNINTIKQIFGSEYWWNELQLDSADTKKCLQPLFEPTNYCSYD